MIWTFFKKLEKNFAYNFSLENQIHIRPYFSFKKVSKTIVEHKIAFDTNQKVLIAP